MCSGNTYDVTVSDANGCSSSFTNIAVLDGVTPRIVSQTMSGACLGLQQGVATVTFDQPIVTAVLYSGLATLNWFGNVLTLSGLSPGTVAYGVVGADEWCSMVHVLDVVQDPTVCGTLSGRVYADLDGSCLQNGAEPGIPHRILVAQPGNRTMLTNSIGDYQVGLIFGNSTLGDAFTGYSADCLSPFPAPFNLSVGAPTVTIDVAETPLTGPDVRAYMWANTHRVGVATNYTVQAHNESPFTMTDVSVDLMYDDLLTLITASGSPIATLPGEVHWTIPSLQPFGVATYNVYLQVPPDPLLLGVVVSATATVGQAMDSDPGNDSSGITRIIVNASDPNEKHSVTSSGAEDVYFIDVDSHVDRTIHFQNVGNAEALNIYILDTISERYDMTSFQLLGASHAMQPSLLEDHTLRFDLPNINLPDSGANEPASHGFVSYRLKPVNGLQPGEALLNAADIFFDFNPTVRTNTAELIAEFSVGINGSDLMPIGLAPNPATTSLRVTIPGEGAIISVLSMDGRVVLQRRSAGTILDLDVAFLAPGPYIVQAFDRRGMTYAVRFIKQ